MVISMMCQPTYVFGLFWPFLALFGPYCQNNEILTLFCSDSDSDGDFDDVPTNKRAPAFQQQTTTVNSMPSFFDSEAPSPPPPAPG